MNDNKVYEPTEIQDSPFPGQQILIAPQGESGGVNSPLQIADKPLPSKNISREMISSVINTKSRKIIGETQFTPSGALQIGKYEEDVSGDVRITKDGIIARNSSGLQTFILDGDDGSVTISSEDDQTVIDSQGIRSTTQFQSFNLVSGTLQSTTSDSFVDVVGSSFTIVAKRNLKIFFSIFAYMQESQFLQHGYQASLRLYDSFLAGTSIGNLNTGGNSSTDITVDGGGNITGFTNNLADDGIEMSGILDIEEGKHDYKLQLRRTDVQGTAYLSAFIINYIILGH